MLLCSIRGQRNRRRIVTTKRIEDFAVDFRIIWHVLCDVGLIKSVETLRISCIVTKYMFIIIIVI